MFFMLSPWIHCLFWFSLQETVGENKMVALENLKVMQTSVSMHGMEVIYFGACHKLLYNKFYLWRAFDIHINTM